MMGKKDAQKETYISLDTLQHRVRYEINTGGPINMVWKYDGVITMVWINNYCIGKAQGMISTI